MGNSGLQMAQNCLDYPGIRLTWDQITEGLSYNRYILWEKCFLQRSPMWHTHHHCPLTFDGLKKKRAAEDSVHIRIFIGTFHLVTKIPCAEFYLINEIPQNLRVSYMEHAGMVPTGENQNTWRNICPSAALSTTNLMVTSDRTQDS
jgi:hypothetical protein